MHRPPFQKEIPLSYSKWSQHRADNGLIYLAHPVTGEVKWLWSRHHDPKTGHDYLVNTITGKRLWVTKDNAHFCPVQAETQPNTADQKPEEGTTRTAPTPTPTSTNPFENTTRKKAPPTATSRPANSSSVTKKLQTTPREEASSQTKPKYREIAAPKSLGLSVDEVLMLVPDTGRRYIFNKKTKTSRWLPDRTPDTISSERRQKPLFARKVSNSPSSPLNDDDDIHPDLKRKTQVPIIDNLQHENTSSYGSRKSVPRTSQVAPLGPTQEPAATIRATPSTMKPVTQELDSMTSQSGRGNEDPVDEVSRRLGSLNTILADVTKTTTSDKYDMSKLRRLSKGTPSKEEAQTGAQRLLELEEYLTQQMLKGDAVESEGNDVIRAKRKETVKAILALTEEVERLRQELST